MMDLSLSIVKAIEVVERRLCPVYCGVVDRRRVIAYLFLTAIEAFVIPFHIILFLVKWEPWRFCTTLIHAAFLVSVQMAIWKRDLAFTKGIAILFLLVFCKLAADCLLSTLLGAVYDEISLAGNIFIMFILVISALSLMLQKTAAVIAVGVVPIILFFLAVQPQHTAVHSIKSFLVGIMMILYVLTYNMSKVTKGLRQPREMNVEERKALEMLANLRDMDYGKAESIWDKLTPQMRKRIMNRATEKLRKEEIDRLAWDMISADLTKTEKKVCRLVLEGKTLKQMCDVLDKTESTVTSTRCHIRKKLNMARKDDLKRTLELKILEIKSAI